MDYRGRFAPSPTGELHLGSLLAALGSWLRARVANGAWLVRIDDIDPPREIPGSARAILRALTACGLEPDEPPLYQSTRLPAYETALEQLRTDGHVFPCWCSRADFAARGGLHRGACVTPPDWSRNPAWRVRAADTVIEFDDGLQDAQRWPLLECAGDFVVKRADGLPAYQLACAVDDAFQGITEVVRGADLLDSTPRQIFLLRLLRLSEPRYLHLPVVVNEAGEKLSKSSGASGIDIDDPLPAMRSALTLLGIPDTAMHGTTPRRLLADALAAFDPATLGATRRAFVPVPLHDRVI